MDNYIDVITYSNQSVKAKLRAKYPDKIHELDNDQIKLKANKILTKRDDIHSVSIIRCEPSELDWISDVYTVLATGRTGTDDCPYSKLTAQGWQKVFLAYKRKSGEPEKFGEFM